MGVADAKRLSILKSHGARSSRAWRREYNNISFIHEIADSSVDDITAEILAEAAVPEIPSPDADPQASRFDHARDLRKHEPV
jgi:hypothetical protein